MGKGQERSAVGLARARRGVGGLIQLSAAHAVANAHNRVWDRVLLLVDEIHQVSRVVGPARCVTPVSGWGKTV